MDELLSRLQEQHSLSDEQINYIRFELLGITIYDYETLELKETGGLNHKQEPIFEVVLSSKSKNKHVCFI